MVPLDPAIKTLASTPRASLTCPPSHPPPNQHARPVATTLPLPAPPAQLDLPHQSLAMATVSADTTAITPPPSLHGGAPSIASTDIPLTRTVSRAETISSSMSSGTSFKLDPNRPKFKVKPREKKAVGSIGGPTESVRRSLSCSCERVVPACSDC